MKYVIRPYKLVSKSAKSLAVALGCKRVKPEYVPRRDEIVINWGNTTVFYMEAFDLNTPYHVRKAIDKKSAYEILGDVAVASTTSKEEAASWNTDVVVRHIINGKGGAGIEIVKKGEPIPDAPLYTKYFKHKKEFRVHVFHNSVIDVIEKRKRKGENPNHQVRNIEGGWVFCREGIVVPDKVKENAILAVRRLALDFGAVDIGWNEYYQEARVFEVNTAPGIEGTTVQKYAEAFNKYLYNNSQQGENQ